MLPSYVTLVLMLLAVGALVFATAVGLTAWSLLHPPRMSDGKALFVLGRMSPGDLGLAFEDVRFSVRDDKTGRRLKLAGWWIPAKAVSALEPPSDRCVVLLHGYADAKVGAIAWAPVWHRLGFHVLALDLRAHGESEGSQTTAGYFERHDVAQVLGQLRAERPEQTRHVVLFGASSGAAVAIATAALDGADDGANVIAAVVMESPFADFRSAAATHMEQLGLPSRWLPATAVWLAEKWSGARFGDVRPLELASRVACPLLVVVSDPDPYLPPTDASALEAAVRSRSPAFGIGKYCCFKDVGHLMAVVADAGAYERCIEAFINAAFEEDRVNAEITAGPCL